MINKTCLPSRSFVAVFNCPLLAMVCIAARLEMPSTARFLFQFINSYFSLIHVAFLKNHLVLFGMYDPCPRHQCMASLGIQLATVFGTQIVLSQILETAYGFV